MPRRILILHSMLLLGVLAGCDSEARQEQVARENLMVALRLVDAAESGYVPVPAGDATPETADAVRGFADRLREDRTFDGEAIEVYQEYRHRQFDTARLALDRVAASGTAQQKRLAEQLAADMDASLARRLSRQALTAWTRVSNRSSVSLAYLTAVVRASARLEELKAEDTSLFRDLQDLERKHQRQLEEQQRQNETIAAEIARRSEVIAGLRSRADENRNKARDLQTQAFTAQGDRRWDLFDEATTFERTAAEFSTRAQREQVQLEVFQARQTVLADEIEATRRTLETVGQQLRTVNARQMEVQQARQKTADELRANEQRLVDEVTALMGEYDTTVRRVFQSAADEADKSIQRVQRAAGHARGQDRRFVDLDLLASRAVKLSVLEGHTVAAADLGSKLRLITRRAAQAIPERQTFFQAMTDQLVAQQGEVINLAKSEIADMLALVETLTQSAAEEDPVADAAMQMRDQVNRANARLEELRLPSR